MSLNENQLRIVHGVWDYPVTFVMFQHVSGHTDHYAGNKYNTLKHQKLIFMIIHKCRVDYHKIQDQFQILWLQIQCIFYP